MNRRQVIERPFILDTVITGEAEMFVVQGEGAGAGRSELIDPSEQVLSPQDRPLPRGDAQAHRGGRRQHAIPGSCRQVVEPVHRLERASHAVAGLDNDLSTLPASERGIAMGAAVATAVRTQAAGLPAQRACPEKVPDRQLQSLPMRESHRSFHTFQIASRMIFLDIFDSPTVLSTKTMGISPMRKPFFHARMLISIWKA